MPKIYSPDSIITPEDQSIESKHFGNQSFSPSKDDSKYIDHKSIYLFDVYDNSNNLNQQDQSDFSKYYKDSKLENKENTSMLNIHEMINNSSESISESSSISPRFLALNCKLKN